MDISDIGNTSSFPQSPGIYIFRDSRKKPLYIGKATNLRSRIRSYFASDLLEKRGPIIVEALSKIKTIDFVETDTVLEALLLEAEMIKKYVPLYNSKEKSNTSFLYIIITKEDFPKILIVRGREMDTSIHPKEVKYQFGPFPSSGQLREALRLIRKIFPYRDRCKVGEKGKDLRPCFNAQIELCPGVCVGSVSKQEYARTIRNIVLFLRGKKKELIKKLTQEMHMFAEKEMFEKASVLKKQIFALRYINDAHLIKRERRLETDECIRIEGYDVSHTAGNASVGVMCVIENGELNPQEYRKFILKKTKPGDDVGGLGEILTRRIHHDEWGFPDCIVVDGGKNQYNRALRILKAYGLTIPVVGVVKDETHTPKTLLGDSSFIKRYSADILTVNQESHRYALSWHRRRRDAVYRKK